MLWPPNGRLKSEDGKRVDTEDIRAVEELSLRVAAGVHIGKLG